MSKIQEEERVVDVAIEVGKRLQRTNHGTEEDLGTINNAIDIVSRWPAIWNVQSSDVQERTLKRKKEEVEAFQVLAYHVVFSQSDDVFKWLRLGLNIVLFAGITVVGIYQSRFEYDQADSNFDFSEKSMMMGLGSGQILLGIGFTGQLLVYFLKGTSQTNEKDISKLMLLVILAILSVSSWWYYSFIQMDYSDDKDSYGEKIENLRLVTNNMSYIFTGLVIGILNLSYAGMTINQDDKTPMWLTWSRKIGVISSILFFVFYIVDMHSLTSSGGSHTADNIRKASGGVIDIKYFGEVGINKTLIILQCIFSVLAATSFATSTVACFVLRGNMMYDAFKYILACAGFVFVSVGSIYGAHAEFGTQRLLPAYNQMIGIGIQFFAYAMIFFALNSTTTTMGGFMTMTKGHKTSTTYY